MKMYTAGYTGHDGYPVTLAEGDSINEVIHNLPFDVDLSSNDTNEITGKDAIPHIVKEIQEVEGTSGWVREAPYTLILGSRNDYDSYSVSRYVSGTSLNDVVSEFLCHSRLFEIEVKNHPSYGSSKNFSVDLCAGSHLFKVYVELTDGGFDITGIAFGSEFSTEDVESLAYMYSDPDVGVDHVVLRMSPTAEVEDAARRVKLAENARLKAVRRAADEGVSQRVLAKLTGVSQATIGRWLKED